MVNSDDMNISQAFAIITGASSDTILTSSSSFIIFLILARGKLWFLKSVTFSTSWYWFPKRLAAVAEVVDVAT
ncbi:hypothetical protein A2U01_0070611, partial [Trifolium medium]|nr:hypothetical protein [Trifolium medium]